MWMRQGLYWTKWSSIQIRIKEHNRHIRLPQTNKSAVAEHTINQDHIINYRIQNFFLQKPDIWTDSTGKQLNWKCTHIRLTEKMAWPSVNPGNHFCTCLKKGESLLKHNSLICTIPWLPFLAPTQCRFSLTYLLQAATWGSLPSTTRFSNRTRPLPFRLPQAIFEPKLLLYKYPSNLIPVILLAYTVYEECFETSAHKIQKPLNHPKERIKHSELDESLKSRIMIFCKVHGIS